MTALARICDVIAWCLARLSGWLIRRIPFWQRMSKWLSKAR